MFSPDEGPRAHERKLGRGAPKEGARGTEVINTDQFPPLLFFLHFFSSEAATRRSHFHEWPDVGNRAIGRIVRKLYPRNAYLVTLM
jgi:hypothetical protein